MGVKINPSMGSKASMTGMLKMTCMLNSPNPQIGRCHQCYYYEILLNEYANINLAHTLKLYQNCLYNCTLKDDYRITAHA